MKYFLSFLLVMSVLTFNAQEKQQVKKINLSGKVIEKSTSLPLEYATITLIGFNSNQVVSGGVTDAKGEFNIEVRQGKYTIKVEFMSFKTQEIKEKSLIENTNLGTIALEDEAQQLGEVTVRAERTAVDIKLDKKVYTVGKDIMVRGGTVSDVLDNVPSVSVSSEGAIALRGNENVRVLIDGKPTNAVNVADALKMIPADAIDKVETITNPSARYDAEGGAGIINVILKKGKNQGTNGTLILSVGDPKNNSASVNVNHKNELMNFFTTIGVNDRENPGRAKIDQENFDKNTGLLTSYLEERRKGYKYGQGLNANFGIELFLDKNTSWTNAFNYRNNDGGNNEDVFYYNYYANKNYKNTSKRDNKLVTNGENVEFTTNFTKKFKREGHKLSIDGAFSQNFDKDDSNILQTVVDTDAFVRQEKSKKHDKQKRNLIQLDYVYPVSEKSQFEAGYRGNFVNLLADFSVSQLDTTTGQFNNLPGFTNVMDYVENVNAVYTQFGSKINKFSYLLGLRYEDSHIEINQLTSQIFKTKNYGYFFPSAFFTYELKENTSISLNYSRRITRPRDRFINPFASYTSNINLFQGNPDINPALSDVFDIGFLKKCDKLTLNASAYLNHTKNAFQVVRKERGDLVDGTPVIINTPFNLSNDDKYGLELTANYNFKKWWKLNGNINYFYNVTNGDYSYVNTAGNTINQNFDFKSTAWTARITSRINLPYKIDWQANINYNAPQKIAQGNQRGVASANTGLSKDLLKDKATLSLNVNDIFNSRKMYRDLRLPNVHSDSEMQFRMRVITLSFTYRFNKSKNEKEQKPKQQEGGGGEGDFGG